MNKIKFNWRFEVDEDEDYLNVYLNDGLNIGIYIKHIKFHENLLNKLLEIIAHEHINDTKTHITGLKEIDKAKWIYNADFK